MSVISHYRKVLGFSFLLQIGLHHRGTVAKCNSSRFGWMGEKKSMPSRRISRQATVQDWTQSITKYTLLTFVKTCCPAATPATSLSSSQGNRKLYRSVLSRKETKVMNKHNFNEEFGTIIGKFMPRIGRKISQTCTQYT